MVNIWHSQRYSQSSGHLDMRREPEGVAYKVRRPDILIVETHGPSKHLDDPSQVAIPTLFDSSRMGRLKYITLSYCWLS